MVEWLFITFYSFDENNFDVRITFKEKISLPAKWFHFNSRYLNESPEY